MFKSPLAIILSMACLVANVSVFGQDEYVVEAIDSPPQADALSAEFAQLFSEKGQRVKSSAGRTIAEVWLSKEWETDPKFVASEQRLYPFQTGQLIGLLHLSRKQGEFRQQEVPSGWYTLRFALQPVDGNHEGTSVTRDFLIMINAERDEPTKQWVEKEMFSASGESIGTTHPSMFSLQRADSKAEVGIRHDAEKDWWIVRLVGKAKAGGQAMPLDFVVVGHAPE